MSAQYLESIEAKPVRFILYVYFLQAQPFGHLIQPGKRGDAVLRKAFMKGPCFFDLAKRHNLQLCIVCFRHMVHCPFD